MPPNKVVVRTYCKIFCDDFPEDGFSEGREATGDEIYPTHISYRLKNPDPPDIIRLAVTYFLKASL